MQLSHKIALDPTPLQISYFKQASGTARFVWNLALAKWKELYASGQKPKAMDLKKQFNAIKYDKYPWLKDMHRDSHAQPFANLAKAWQRFFADIKAKKQAHEPCMKRKGKSRDSFYIANDKFKIKDQTVYLPKVGKVKMREALRFEGKILGATVSRTADRWYIAIQVNVPDNKAKRERTANEIVGLDLGITAAVTLSTGEKIHSPRPLKSALRRLKILSHSVSRKIKAAKQKVGINKEPIPKGERLPISNNRKKSALKLAKKHSRIANIRADFTHKLTNRLCRENQTVVIEDLNIKGMLKNEKLARAINDIGFGEIRRQLAYKALCYGSQFIIANRWYPSSKLCSLCNKINEKLNLNDRVWKCSYCGKTHDRDINAAINLRRLATRTVLPEANHLATVDPDIGMVPILGGKVTSVRYECGREDESGQKENREHVCSHF